MINFEEDGMDGADCADSEQDNSREQVGHRYVFSNGLDLTSDAFLTLASFFFRLFLSSTMMALLSSSLMMMAHIGGRSYEIKLHG